MSVYALAKVAGNHACQKIEFNADDATYKKQFIQDCSPGERDDVELCRSNVLKVLDSCLRSFNHVNIIEAGEEWNRLLLGQTVDFKQRRFAGLTPGRVRDLVGVMKLIQFKKDSSKSDTYAYVYPNDPSRTVYLCDLFWKALDRMGVDCKMGTLIHEVSHFLGTKDLTYERNKVEGVYRIYGASKKSGVLTAKVDCYLGELATINANNLECSCFGLHQLKTRWLHPENRTIHSMWHSKLRCFSAEPISRLYNFRANDLETAPIKYF
jgi:Lysine-specific metallo-endopeptidase